MKMIMMMESFLDILKKKVNCLEAIHKMIKVYIILFLIWFRPSTCMLEVIVQKCLEKKLYMNEIYVIFIYRKQLLTFVWFDLFLF